MVGVAPLVAGIAFDAMLADKAFDSNRIIADMNAGGALICITQRPQRLAPRVIDPEITKCRNLIKNFFMKLKEFKRIAMRADKTDTSFTAMIYAVAALLSAG